MNASITQMALNEIKKLNSTKVTVNAPHSFDTNVICFRW